MAAFHEILFPAEISYGSSGGPRFKTTIFTADSGYEQRNVDWSNQKAEYDVSHGIKNQAQMDELTAFFYARRARAYGFRYKDWNDYSIAAQQIEVGDGTTKDFQIVKTYRSAQTESGEVQVYTRKLTKIAWNTLAGVTVGGVVVTQSADPDTGQKWTLNANTGILTFANAPAEDAAIVIGSAQFHVPVRFDTDHLDVTQDFWNTASWPNIPLVEVRDWGEALS
jgi:TIGR02217 family protein